MRKDGRKEILLKTHSARVWAAELGCKHTFITSMSSVACLCVCVCTTALFHSSSWVHTYRIYLV